MVNDSKVINYDYLKIYEEIPLLFSTYFLRKTKSKETSGKTLIVVASLIGDFLAALPALRTFIKDHKIKADIIVSAPVKPLAEKVRGIDKVFIAKSSSKRDIERSNAIPQKFDEYDRIIIMRISSDAYRLLKNIKSAKIRSSFLPYTKYAFHLAKHVILGRRPKQWREVNFEMVGKKPRHLGFNDLFDIKKEDYARARKLKELKTNKKILLVHTGSNWPMLRWENKKWADLLNRIDALRKFRIIFVGAKIEEQDLKEIKPLLNFKPSSLINKVDLGELLTIMRLSDCFIGVDSGPRNLANFADLRSISLFGPGPHMFMPVNKENIIINKSGNRGLYQRFFYKKKGFMSKITVDEVYDKFLTFL